MKDPCDAARILIRYALEESACWSRLHQIVEEERERVWPSPHPQVIRRKQRKELGLVEPAVRVPLGASEANRRAA